MFCALRWSDNSGLSFPALSLLCWEEAYQCISTMMKRRKQRLGAPSLRIQISSPLYSHCRGNDVHQHMFSPTSAPGLQHLKFPFSADCALVTSPLVFYLNSKAQSNPSSPCYSHPFQWSRLPIPLPRDWKIPESLNVQFSE